MMLFKKFSNTRKGASSHWISSHPPYRYLPFSFTSQNPHQVFTYVFTCYSSLVSAYFTCTAYYHCQCHRFNQYCHGCLCQRSNHNHRYSIRYIAILCLDLWQWHVVFVTNSFVFVFHYDMVCRPVRCRRRRRRRIFKVYTKTSVFR